jgi:hypothetical protein
MSDDVPASRTQRLTEVKAATDESIRVDINPDLHELFGQLVEANVAIGDATWILREKPSPGIGRRLADLHLQMGIIISRINYILG